jgi:hypothetical protein
MKTKQKLREQARSHREIHVKGGSEPAREGVGPFKENLN